jgi:sugar phosphate isomerase/epimerase
MDDGDLRPGWQLGISSYTYTWAIGVPGHPVDAPLSVWGLLEQAQALGVAVVQYADNLPLDQLAPDELTRLAQEATAGGIGLEVGTRGIDPAHLRRNLRVAAEVGSPLVRVVIDQGGHEPGLDEVVATLRPLLPDFAAAGVILAIENHDRFHAATLVMLMQQLDSPWVGICLDTVNSLGALEGPTAVVEALGPYTVNLHIKDFAIRRVDHQMGFVVEGRPAGKGMLDVPWLLDVLAAQRGPCRAIVELWTPPQATLAETIVLEAAWAHTSVVKLRRWIGG